MTDETSSALVDQGRPNLPATSRFAERTLSERAARGSATDTRLGHPRITSYSEVVAGIDPAEGADHVVTQVALGVQAIDGTMSLLIPRNTSVPADRSQVFSTVSDNQPRLELHLVQGERPIAADNELIGRLVVDGIPPAPRGAPRLEITLRVDADGRLDATARDCATNREMAVRLGAIRVEVGRRGR